jgi:predicted RNase H-like nuclease
VAVLDGGRLTVSVEAAIGPWVDKVAGGTLDALAIDMPIGLPATGQSARACDSAARRLLGPRRSSVFPTPARACLGATSYRDACERSFAAVGKQLSIQAFHLLPRVQEVDDAMTPDLQDRAVEAHPELAFARLAGHPLCHPKRSPAGRDERRDVLAAAGLRVPVSRLVGAAPDDVLDAVVLTLVARAVVERRAERLGDRTRDARGLRMEIVTLDERGSG